MQCESEIKLKIKDLQNEKKQNDKRKKGLDSRLKAIDEQRLIYINAINEFQDNLSRIQKDEDNLQKTLQNVKENLLKISEHERIFSLNKTNVAKQDQSLTEKLKTLNEKKSKMNESRKKFHNRLSENETQIYEYKKALERLEEFSSINRNRIDEHNKQLAILPFSSPDLSIIESNLKVLHYEQESLKKQIEEKNESISKIKSINKDIEQKELFLENNIKMMDVDIIENEKLYKNLLDSKKEHIIEEQRFKDNNEKMLQQQKEYYLKLEQILKNKESMTNQKHSINQQLSQLNKEKESVGTLYAIIDEEYHTITKNIRALGKDLKNKQQFFDHVSPSPCNPFTPHSMINQDKSFCFHSKYFSATVSCIKGGPILLGTITITPFLLLFEPFSPQPSQIQFFEKFNKPFVEVPENYHFLCVDLTNIIECHLVFPKNINSSEDFHTSCIQIRLHVNFINRFLYNLNAGVDIPSYTYNPLLVFYGFQDDIKNLLNIIPYFKNQSQTLFTAKKVGARSFSFDLDSFSSSLPTTEDKPPRRLSSDFHNIKICCNDQSSILSNDKMDDLLRQLPTLLHFNKWKMIYFTKKDGISLTTFLNRAKIYKDTLIICQTSRCDIFGGFASDYWRVHPEYFGTGECFVYRFFPHLETFHWSGKNSCFMLCYKDAIAMGGGGNFAFYLDKELFKGSSGECKTFSSPCLCSENNFEIESLELWAPSQI